MPSDGIKPGDEADFDDPNSGQQSLSQSYLKHPIIFGNGRGGMELCTRSPSPGVVATKLSDAALPTVPVETSVKHEVEENLLGKAKLKAWFVKLRRRV